MSLLQIELTYNVVIPEKLETLIINPPIETTG